ncbi:hypothetical protein F5148DRAFT_1242614 [Russula earlei]|uniref:Uncharacterized protein n=1 Tax=Russula earlei TaxID=71964 RepID=A0ACC0TVD0_9AGAM|nr:hypothetical protein F5148DRAFT_1242614 [Russula earlei]
MAHPPRIPAMTAVNADGVTMNSSLTIGLILIADLLNAYLFGVVSQQFYSYWTISFKDSKRVRVFVVTQFSIILFQSLILWMIAWRIFVACRWRTLLGSISGCVLVLSANVFLAIRIHSLTRSRLQSGITLAFSSSAFALGITTAIMTWSQNTTSAFLITETVSPRTNATATVWQGLQAISEALITGIGVQKTDSVVEHLVRNVIQIGLLAALWAVGGLVTWLFLAKTAVYLVLSATAGSLYTHLIYDTLLSRIQLREHMVETIHTEMALPTQMGPCIFNRRQLSSVSMSNSTVSTTTNSTTSTRLPGPRETLDSEEIKYVHAEQ